jgi:multidrug resistance efflux pump
MFRLLSLPKLILTILVIALGLSACSGLGAQSTPTPTPAVEKQFNPVISVTGAVTPARWANLSLSGSGIAVELPAKEGDVVKSGQLLVQLNGSDRLQATITAAEMEQAVAQKDLNDLKENAVQARSAAQLRLATAQKALDEAKKRRTWKNYQPGNQNQIDIARADLVTAKEAVKQAENAFGYASSRAEDDPERAALLSMLAAARLKRDKAQSNLNYLLALPKKLDVDEADAQLGAAQSEVEAAQREVERLKDGPDPQTLQVTEARLKNAQSQLDAARAALSDLELRAPFDGTISRLMLHPQEWVPSGQPVVLLADLTSLQVETTDLSEIDVARIQVGNLADVTFDALPDVKVQAGVVRISPKAAEGAGVNYTVVIKLLEIPARLRWGMTAFVDIQTEP